MTITVHLTTGEHIPCRDISSFRLHTDRLVLRGIKSGDCYEFQRRKIIGFDVAFMPYTNVGVKRG